MSFFNQLKDSEECKWVIAVSCSQSNSWKLWILYLSVAFLKTVSSEVVCQVRCIILRNTESQHLFLLFPSCLPLCLCFPSSLSLHVSLCVSLWGACRVGNVLERREREWPRETGEGAEVVEECWTCSTCRLEELEPTPSNSRHQGRGREDRWTEHQDRKAKLSPEG